MRYWMKYKRYPHYCVRFEDVSTISTAPTTVTIDPAYTGDITVTVRSKIVFLSQFR